MMKRKLLFPVALLLVAASALAQTSSVFSLLSNASTTGPAVGWPGGVGVFSASGTWGGGTVTLEFLGPDGTTYLAAGTQTTLTSNGAGVFYLPHTMIKALVSGGAPSALYATASVVQAGY